MKFRSGIKSWLSLLVAVSFAIPALLSIFGFISIRAVLSDSMEPKIQIGDVVVTANWVSPSLGDVAMYRQRDIQGVIKQDVVHRVITMSSTNEYEFKGDNNRSMDALKVKKSDIIGTVVLKVPAVGSLFNAGGLFSLMLLIGGIYLITYAVRKLRK